jgi:hypothetical protein
MSCALVVSEEHELARSLLVGIAPPRKRMAIKRLGAASVCKVIPQFRERFC